MPGTSKSGRKRKPLEARVLEGTFRTREHGPLRTTPVVFPEPPEHLSASARELWKQFPRAGWIDDSDRLVVEAAVAIYDRILALRRDIGETVDRGAFEAEAKLWGRLLSILSSLGLTPADRAKMPPAVPDDAEDKWAGMLS